MFGGNGRSQRAPVATLMLGLLLVVLSCALYACNDCDPGSRRCNGSELELCQSDCSDVGCGASWSSAASCLACIEPQHGDPFCAESSTPESHCDGQRGFCDGDKAVGCESGYRAVSIDCGSHGVCVAPKLHEPIALNDEAAFCASSAATDARCGDSQGFSEHCDHDAILQCQSGFLIASNACPVTATHCLVADGTTSCASQISAADGGGL